MSDREDHENELRYEARETANRTRDVEDEEDEPITIRSVQMRTAQDADNALLVRALAREIVLFTSRLGNGIYLVDGRRGALAGQFGGWVKVGDAGDITLTDDIRAALRRALGEE